MGIVFAVRHIMTENIVSVEKTVLVNEAASVMVENKIGSVVVAKDGKLIGIITERDILKKCCLGNKCTEKLSAGEIMSTPIITINADASLGEASMLMNEKNVRRLLVTDKGKIVGIITQKDVLRGTLSYFENVVTL